MQGIKIEPLERGEESQLAQIHNVSFEDHIHKYGQFSELRRISAGDVENWRKSEFFDSHGLLKAEVNRIVVGYSYAKIKQVANEKGKTYMAGYLENMSDSCSLLCVLPDWRRRKIGSKLLRDSERFIQSKGFGFIVSWAYKSDSIAKGFLKKVGYGHREKFYVEEFSEVLPLNADVEFWQKDLTKPIVSREIKEPKGYLVRLYRQGDEGDYVKIHNLAWSRYGWKITTKDAERILSGSRRERTFFVEIHDEAVGSAYFNEDGGIHLTGVTPEHRGKGVGTALLAKTFEHMQLQGYKAAYMSTSVVLEDVLALYRKLDCTRVEKLLCMVKLLI